MNGEWQNLSAQELEEELDTNTEVGMTEELARQKLGRKASGTGKMHGWLYWFLVQLASVFNGVLILTAVLLMALGNAGGGLAVIAAVLLKCAYLGWRTNRFGAYLKKLEAFSMQQVSVIRGGKAKKIPAADVVEGDLAELNAGEKICFPMKIVSDSGLVILPEDAGEAYAITEADKNRTFVLPGMRVAFGNGKGVVIENDYVPPVAEKGLKKKKTDKFLYLLSGAALLICLVLAVSGIFREGGFSDYLFAAIGLFIVICPADLISGAQLSVMEGLMKTGKNGVVSLSALETLEQADTIVLNETAVISDKMQLCGIVTEYRAFDMQASVSKENRAVLKMLQEFSALCTLAELEAGMYKGEPEELACIRAAAKHGVYKEALTEKYPYVFKLPKEDRLTVGVEIPNGVRVITKGSAEAVLGLCDEVMSQKSLKKLTDDKREALMQTFQELADAGLYVSALAFSDNDADTKGEKTNLIFLGFLCCAHVPSEQGIRFIHKCEKSGLAPVLITELDKPKACAIQNFYSENIQCVSGEEIRQKTDRDLELAVQSATLFCSVQPADKIRILKALKQAGKTVLLPVENPEDARYADKATVAIACGTAAESAKQMCAGSVSAKEGILSLIRGAVCASQNAERVYRQGLAVKSGILLFAMLAAIFVPYIAVLFSQYLWIGILLLPVTMLFISKSAAGGKMKKQTWIFGLCLGAIFGLIAFLAHFFGRYTISAAGEAEAVAIARTVTFWVLTGGVLILGLQAVTDKLFIFGGFLKNKWAAVCTLLCVGLGLCLQYIPGLQTVFGLTVMKFNKGIWLFVFMGMLILSTDLVKYIESLKRKR